MWTYKNHVSNILYFPLSTNRWKIRNSFYIVYFLFWDFNGKYPFEKSLENLHGTQIPPLGNLLTFGCCRLQSAFGQVACSQSLGCLMWPLKQQARIYQLIIVPSRKLTYPTWGKGKHLQNGLFRGYVSSQEGILKGSSKTFLGKLCNF